MKSKTARLGNIGVHFPESQSHNSYSIIFQHMEVILTKYNLSKFVEKNLFLFCQDPLMVPCKKLLSS